jgi:hypothetical protein
MKLYKTTITVWTKENPEEKGRPDGAYEFGAAVHNGDAFCRPYDDIKTVEVDTREEICGWEVAEFFGEKE